ncbi:hypothetical protein [Burkholderia oklahomensis]|uniref:hypothetical protein n=1 Tax=Burkholderia oklahomensis TaxID=342113 RepID=UPI000A7005A5|nr:hypothetical protein [Burkholderia oklahomensis]QPS39398.1 hypothetical protein I6G57_26495 [Burkholderia oklahomensis]
MLFLLKKNDGRQPRDLSCNGDVRLAVVDLQDREFRRWMTRSPRCGDTVSRTVPLAARDVPLVILLNRRVVVLRR